MQKSRKEQLLDFLKDEPEDAFLRYALALEHVKEGNSQGGIEELEHVIRRDRNYVAAYYQLGKLYEAVEKEKALDAYRQGMEVARGKKDMHTFNELKSAYHMLNGDFDEDEDY